MYPHRGDARTARDRALVFRVFSSFIWVRAVLESPAAQQATLSARGKVLNLVQMEAQTAKTTSRSHLAMRYCAIASHRHPVPNIPAESGALVLPDQLDKVLVRARLLSHCAPTAILSCSRRVDFVLFDAPRALKTSRATANIPKLSSYGPSRAVQIPGARDPPELPAWEPTWSEMEAFSSVILPVLTTRTG
jgi:hypothetical protein